MQTNDKPIAGLSLILFISAVQDALHRRNGRSPSKITQCCIKGRDLWRASLCRCTKINYTQDQVARGHANFRIHQRLIDPVIIAHIFSRVLFNMPIDPCNTGTRTTTYFRTYLCSPYSKYHMHHANVQIISTISSGPSYSLQGLAKALTLRLVLKVTSKILCVERQPIPALNGGWCPL